MLGEIVYAMAPAQGQGSQQSPYSFLIFMGVIFAIFYFLLIRPQQKRQKEHRRLLDNLKKGDRVVTTGGLYGTIAGLADTTITLEIADKVKVKVGRSYIAGVMKPE
ncbi:MAG: preprotein translocase subunit YajC [Deltaproteobacteria bacterium RBG_16_54_18]|jgi:preprotein translocase subunit YajC|nr:MAG: preprotein translocase subunit YajC [Deltaproteobacteria bacterium RBG_16_54_18]